MARSDLAGLGAGDVILFERFGVRDARGGPVTLRLGRGGFGARLDGDALTIEEQFRLNRGVSSMEFDPSQKGEAASANELLRELPVEVVCELGRVTMSGRELIELRPGAVIPAGRPLSGPVDLTVGGRVVARGELVDVEGEIGVRITAAQRVALSGARNAVDEIGVVGGVRLAALDGFTEHSHTLALERAIEVSVLHEQPGRRCAVVTDETFRRPAVHRHDLFHSRRRAQIDGAELGVEPLSPCQARRARWSSSRIASSSSRSAASITASGRAARTRRRRGSSRSLAPCRGG